MVLKFSHWFREYKELKYIFGVLIGGLLILFFIVIPNSPLFFYVNIFLNDA